MRLSPLAQRTLASKAFSAGKQVLANTSGDLIYRGVIDQIVLAQDAVKLHYRPLTARSDLLLAQTEGYSADYVRASIDLMVLTGVAEKVWDWFRDYEDLAAFSDTAESKMLMMRSIEEQLVLNSLAVNNVIVLRALVEVLALTQHVHQSVLVEYITHVLVIGQSCDLRTDFLRLLDENLTIAHVGSVKTTFLRNMAEVMALSHDTAVNADFVRALSNLLVLIDDAEGDRIIGGVLEAVSQTLTLSQGLLKTTAFNRIDGRTLSLTTNAVGTRVTACDKITWNSIGTTDWPNYQACIKNNVGRSGADSFDPNPFTGVSAGTNMWRSAILAPNGYLYAIPLSATYVLKIDYTNNSSANIGSELTGNLKWAGGAIRLDGKILGCPWNSTSILEIITSNDTTNTFGNIAGSTKYSCAVTNKAGNTYFIPFDSTTLDYVANGSYNVSEFTSGLTGGDKYVGACVGPDGYKIFAVPATATKVIVIDTGPALTKKDLTDEEIGNGKWHGAVMTENGMMYGIPYNSTKVLKVDMAAETKSTFGSLTGSAKWAGGAYALNQKIYCASWNSTTYLEIDTTNDATASSNSATGNNKWAGAATIQDGRVLFIPNDIDQIGALNPNDINSPTVNVILSPHWNCY